MTEYDNGYEAGQDAMLEKILTLIAERADFADSTDGSIELNNLYADIERIFS